ncbi:N-acetylglutaminylglutamine synthetase [Jiella sp. MQZ9-1]|uniref:N-acetylglutaminylglutamine synthetase n=1 Tax=Jiella flava TaxID=2816857 RepID=A0A939JT25_9HYPH|nr:N-acetylglutaminylglutamine synthetase [Jiella flava]MBO0663543.1 N-acetylglutaminylglutamine synthetase [Jiella flava]MCD2472118.1 N-acetylglutaminylglutamine synthetase [Jiella flava]
MAGEKQADRSYRGGGHRLEKLRAFGPRGSAARERADADGLKRNAILDCGWGRLVFGQTFDDPRELANSLREEGPDRRDIAFYVKDPHVLLSHAPQELFLDPSHTYRLDLSTYRPSSRRPRGYFIRRLASEQDATEVNRIYQSRGMVQVHPAFFWSNRDNRALTYFVAEDETTGAILGTVTGVHGHRAFGDPENGSSLWCLAVDPQATHPGIGESLVRRLAEHFQARGCAFMDLSVMHDNDQAIALYDKLGFVRVAYFTIKRKNEINERLFTGPNADYEGLNPYARIIVDEARRRGIHTEVVDAAGGFFRLTHGGRTILCRESLSDLTSAVAMSICDDKAVTRRMVEAAGVVVPEQIAGDSDDETITSFLQKHGQIVVKPARGEQGRGISVGIECLDEAKTAIAAARQHSENVLLEACFQGNDLRLIVIDYRLVAAALRKPPVVTGDGRSSVHELIEHLSRRRSAATGGESKVPLDAETERCVRQAGFGMDDVPPEGERITVRKTANLHTGGTIHDVTCDIHPALVEAAVAAARAIEIPVTGIDLMIKSPALPDYVFIEANERPGLANHEPQPTAERFIDLLFPLSMPFSVRAARTQQRRSRKED